MTHKDEALKLALEALEESETNNDTMEFWDRKTKAITAIQQALATPVQEPDAMGCKCSECGEWQRWTPSGMVCKNGHGGASGINQRLYTTPPAAQRQWVGLTDEEIIDVIHPLVMADMSDQATDYEIARAIEAKLKEKNNG